jgi:hypothetical protein
MGSSDPLTSSLLTAELFKVISLTASVHKFKIIAVGEVSLAGVITYLDFKNFIFFGRKKEALAKNALGRRNATTPTFLAIAHPLGP